MEKVYYSPRGYWRGIAAIKKLADAAGVSQTEARAWLKKQAIWQIYLPAPRRIPRQKFDVSAPNEVHQADVLFLPHDKMPGRGRRKTYKYALTVVDVASRYKAAEPLTSKDSGEVTAAFARIYSRGPLRWPKLLQVDPGREFMGQVSTAFAEKGAQIRRSEREAHRGQAIVERFNRTLAERLFGHQYAQELLSGREVRSREWVARLPAVVAALNNEVTRLIGMKPSDAIKLRTVSQKPSTPARRAVGRREKLLPSDVRVRYLYQPGELEGGGRRRATDPIWSLDIYRVGRSVTKPDEPILYYLLDGPGRGFVREELLIVPRDTQLPPDGVLRR